MDKIIAKKTIKLANGRNITINLYNSKLKNCINCDTRLKPKIEKVINKKGKIVNASLMSCGLCQKYYLHLSPYNNLALSADNVLVQPSVDKTIRSSVKSESPRKEVIKHKTPTPKIKIRMYDEVTFYKDINNSCMGKHQSSVKIIDLPFLSVTTQIERTIKGYYCEECHCFFMRYKAFKDYKEPIFPLFNCDYSDEFSKKIKEQSLLNTYGYNVQEGKLSVEQRRFIIDYVIENGIMTKREVVNLLLYLIHLGENNKDREGACYKWQSDIEYVNMKFVRH